MKHRRRITPLTLATLAAAGVVAGALAPFAFGKAHAAPKPVAITVVAKEFSFTFSKSTVPAGTTVTFTVWNKGKIDHNFSIAGKTTPTIKPGKSATLTVTFAKKGLQAYLCTLPGHAAAGMKGRFAIGVAPAPAPAPAPTPTPTPTPTPPPPTPTTGPETLGGDPVAGKAIFLANGCSGCHTLAAAGANGTLAPNLDLVKPGQSIVKFYVSSGATAGGVTMPVFSLSATDLNNLAAFVYQATHS